MNCILGKSISLRPFLSRDIDSVFEWRSDTSDLHLWYPRMDIMSFPEFTGDFDAFLRNYCHAFMCIQKNGDTKPIGLVYSYKSDSLNGVAYLCTYINSENRKFWYGAEATLLFIDYLFVNFPYRKLYTETYGHNIQSIRNTQKGYFQQEGLLKSHIWRVGKYQDLFIFAIYKEIFYSKFGKTIERLKKHGNIE